MAKLVNIKSLDELRNVKNLEDFSEVLFDYSQTHEVVDDIFFYLIDADVYSLLVLNNALDVKEELFERFEEMTNDYIESHK